MARLKGAELVLAKLKAVEFGDCVAQSGKGAADLAVAALSQNHRKVRSLGGPCRCYHCEFTDPVRQSDAEIRNHLLVEGLERFVEFDCVDFFFAELGVGLLKGEITVIGEQDKTGTVFIKATDGFKFVVFGGQKLVEGGSITLGATRTDIADGFMKSEIEKIR